MTDPRIGSEIGSYQVIEPIGQGGMGKVYRAKHPGIGKEVAIKFLQSDFAHDKETLHRFEQEAKAVNQIKHPNIVDILDFGHTASGDFYMIMELLEGRSLKTLIEETEVIPSLERTCDIALQICSALYASHQKDIVHRDLKSDNIFLTKNGGKDDFVKIFDFGLAKFVGEQKSLATTSPGMTVGTPLYMSPEQAFGRDVDHQTDIYALGIVLYRMTTRAYPFNDKNPFVVASQQISTPLNPPSQLNPAINPQLEHVIMRCLEKTKDRRYPTMEAVAEDLCTVSGFDISRYFHHRTPTPIKTTSPAKLYASIAVSILVLIAGGYFLGAALTEEPPTIKEELIVNVIQMTQEPETLPTSVPVKEPKPKPKPKPKQQPQQKTGFFKGFFNNDKPR